MKQKMVEGEGPLPCMAMVIGEAPGSNEEKLGRPFVGKSGSILEEAFAINGVDRKQVYITNVYKYRPPGNRTPTEKEIASQSMILHKEMTDCCPKVILLLGKTAAEQFIALPGGIVKNAGICRTIGDFIVIPTVHPSYVLRSRTDRFEAFLKDVTLFLRIARLAERE